MQLAQGWSVEIERGPDWIFAHLRRDPDTPGEATELADSLWDLLQCHLGRRMVVEMNDVPHCSNYLLDQLARLSRRVHEAGGVLRLCGVPPQVQESIQAAQLDRLLSSYETREAAVMGHRPRQPR